MAEVKKLQKPRIRCTQGVDVGARIKAIYEGASRSPRMGTKGLSGVGGPNADIMNSLSPLRKRSRHAVRNNPYATSAVDTYVYNLIGNGIKAKWESPGLQALWNKWVLQCDADGEDNFYGLQALAARSQFESGEVLGRRRVRRPEDRLVVPLQVQLLEADHLDEGLNQNSPTGNIVMGVGFNTWGRKQAYHLWRNHPGDIAMQGINERVSVPATDILHMFRRLRPGQIRGLPELTPILIRLYEIDEMQDATLVKQKTAQLFGWIIKKKSFDPDMTPESNQMGRPTGETTDDGMPISEIRSGGIHYLDDDEEVSFSSPDGIGDNYGDWLKTELRASAKAAGLTYEQMTGDLEGVSYSSIRAGLIEFRRRIEHLQLHMLIHKFCMPVAQWFTDLAVISGKVYLTDYWQDPLAHLPCWKAPRWDWVDPLKDVMADVIEVRAGLNSRTNKVSERGLDIDEVDSHLMKEQEGSLVLDSDPSKVTKSGAYQAAAEFLKYSED